MNYVRNWIQQDDFNLLHNMWGAKFSLLHSMWGSKCTICKVQSLSICWKSIVLQGKINVLGRCLLCIQTTGCMAEYFTTAEYFYKTSASAIKFVSRQPNTVDSFRSLALACQCMEMLNKGGITSIPTSIAPRLSCRVCAALQSVQIEQSASLHSFKLVFLVSART